MKKEQQESCHKVIKFCYVNIFISYILFLHTFYFCIDIDPCGNMAGRSAIYSVDEH